MALKPIYRHRQCSRASMKFRLEHFIFAALILGVVVPQQIAAAAQVAPYDADYILGPGDVLSVDDNAGSTTSAPILPDGTVVINHARAIYAAGNSLNELNKLVNESAKLWSARP